MTKARSQLQAAVEVTDLLRSPGGCPWDAEQTHSSLAPFLLEEAYETLEAIETEDPVALREELGDLLFQVLIHARLAEEAADGFGIEEVAGDLVEKLTRRHPHVFADARVSTSGEVIANWDEIKRVEKQRQSVTEGIPIGQPALALAAKLISRSGKAGLPVPLPTGDSIGDRLLAIVGEAVQAGIDPEQALRTAARSFRQAVLTEEARRGAPAAG